MKGFDDFDESSLMTLFHARSVVAELGGGAITPEHLLLGLLQASPAAVARFLAPSASIEVVTQQVRDKLPTGVRLLQSVEIPFSRDATLVLDKAIDGTGAFQTIRPEHILLAVLEKGHGPAVDVLRTHGVVHGDVRNYLTGSRAVPST
jgi:ATP-dependent Clp protease ATP-binding subunit ClpA